MKSEIFFTTGDFAKLCEVTKQTLFHYDHIGLLHPDHKDSNGYRYYSYNQLEIMYVIESLKEIEMPLSEIKEFISITTPDTMIDLFREKSKQITEKVNMLLSIQNTIEKKIALTEAARTIEFDKITIQQMETEYLYMSAPLVAIDGGDNKEAIADFYRVSMSQLHEKYSIGATIAKEDLMSGDHGNYRSLFARTEYTDALPLTKIEPTLRVIGYHTGSLDHISTSYTKIFQFMNSRQLSMIDYAYAEPILDRISVNDIDQYVTKITIPVVPAK